MIEKRVRDNESNTEWHCVQALSGINGKLSEEAIAAEGGSEDVDVVCTPSGGEQSVRLSLTTGWAESVNDDELISLIREKRK